MSSISEADAGDLPVTQRELHQILNSLRHGPAGLLNPSVGDTTNGSILLQACKKHYKSKPLAFDDVVDYDCIANFWSTLSNGVLDHLKARPLFDDPSPFTMYTIENDFVRDIAPRLQQLIKEFEELLPPPHSPRHYRIGVSQNHPWVQSMKELRKPDLFFAHQSAIAVPKQDEKIEGDLTSTAEWRLRDAVACYFEAKMTMSLHKDLFQCACVANDVMVMGAVDRLVHSCNFVLFDQKRVCLLRFLPHSSGEHAILDELIEFNWNSPGSFLAFMSFIYPTRRPEWVDVLEGTLAHWSVSLRPELSLVSKKFTAFLGMGATGRVFRVEQGVKVYALKVVLSLLDGSSLDEEVQTILNYRAHDDLHHMLPSLGIEHSSSSTPRDVLFHYVTTSDQGPHTVGSAMLLCTIGVSLYDIIHGLKPDESLQRRFFSCGMFALSQLHRRDLTHGDARLPNMIVVLDGQKPFKTYKSIDAQLKHLLESGHLVFIDLNPALSESITRPPIRDCRMFLFSFFQLDALNGIHTLREEFIDSFFNLMDSYLEQCKSSSACSEPSRELSKLFDCLWDLGRNAKLKLAQTA